MAELSVHRMSSIISLAAWGALMVGASGPAAGASFRIDNRVLVGEQPQPASQSVTVFHEGWVYDFLDKPAETLVYDRGRGQLTLLDTTRRISTRLTAQEVLVFVEQLRERMAGQKDPAVQFLLAPAFHEQFDPQTGVLSLEGSWMSYRVETMPGPDPESVRLYRDFSDWYARLSPIVNPTARPPFARLMLNAALEEHNVLPRAVTLTITTKKGLLSKRLSVRSEHQLVSQLAQQDLDRVVQTQQFMAIFNAVSLEQFRKPTPQASRVE